MTNNKQITVEHWLRAATHILNQADIPTARLDALVLLEDYAKRDRAWLLAHPEYTLSASQLGSLNHAIERRTNHEPLAYIRGKTEFYGRQFMVTRHVLEPRPETETMIELLGTIPITPNCQIVDVGTGSGALAITAKLEVPHARVAATDIDNACINIARQNAAKHSVEIQFYTGNLLEPLPIVARGSVLLCNLPYVPHGYRLNRAATNEPPHAIFGGPDGLDLYRALFQQVISHAEPLPQHILAESLPSQHQALRDIAQQARYKCTHTADFIQVFTPAG